MVYPIFTPDPKPANRDFPTGFETQKELDPDFLAFNSENRRYHFPFRFYLPRRGVFGQADPLSQVSKWFALDSMSLYRYGSGSPVEAVDPLGLQDWRKKAKRDEEQLYGRCYTPECCCCADDVNITTIFPWTHPDDPDVYGHRFTVRIDLHYHEITDSRHGKPGECSLSWKEHSTRFAPDLVAKGAKRDQWNDLYVLWPSHPAFDPWNKQQKPCPGTPPPVVLTDKPAQDLVFAKRTVYWAIRVTSASDCPCTTGFVEVYATQILSAKSGEIVDRFLKRGIPKEVYEQLP